MKKYLLYIRRYSILTNTYRLYVYRVGTDNVYRIIGKIVVTSLEQIKRVSYTRWSEAKENYWKEQGVEVVDYKEPLLSEETDEE